MEGALLPNLRGEVLPAGKRRKVQRLGRRVPETVELLASPACRVLLGPVEPGAREGCSLDQGASGVHSRPVLRTRDEILLAAVGEHISKTLDLG